VKRLCWSKVTRLTMKRRHPSHQPLGSCPGPLARVQRLSHGRASSSDTLNDVCPCRGGDEAEQEEYAGALMRPGERHHQPDAAMEAATETEADGCVPAEKPPPKPRRSRRA
jgi:hypothetical protein